MNICGSWRKEISKPKKAIPMAIVSSSIQIVVCSNRKRFFLKSKHLSSNSKMGLHKKIHQKVSLKDYNILQNSSVNSLFAHMPWKDQKGNMNCFYKTFLILLRSRPINRQTVKNMPTSLSIWRINKQWFSHVCQHKDFKNSCFVVNFQLLCLVYLQSNCYFYQNVF